MLSFDHFAVGNNERCNFQNFEPGHQGVRQKLNFVPHLNFEMKF